MNQIELNAILYYADFLSLKSISQPVTDNCKYFFVHGTPINSAYILDLEPIYDEDNEYFKQAKVEYQAIKDKFGDDGVQSFIDDICCIKAMGSVNAEQMLQRIHQFNNKKQRKLAYDRYYTWRNNQLYTHITINGDGKPEEIESSRFVYHTERMLERSGLAKRPGNYSQRH